MKTKNVVIDDNPALPYVTLVLTQGKTTTVSRADLDRVLQYRWHAWFNTTSRRWYATGTVNGKEVKLHRFIAGTPRGLDTDHANGDSLDNRRENLRIATRGQNQANRPAPRNNTLGLKGIVHNSSGRYGAQISIGGRQIHLGTFDTKSEAAKAYDEAALTLFGQFARPNFPAVAA